VYAGTLYSKLQRPDGGVGLRVLGAVAAAAALVVGLAGCRHAGNPPTSAPTSAWNRILDQVHPDGSVDMATALNAFALAVAPLPGVTPPPGAAADVRSGTLAVSWVYQHWAQLSQAQQQAVDAAVSVDAWLAPGQGGGAQAPEVVVATCRGAVTDSAGAEGYRPEVDRLVAELGDRLGRHLRLPLYLTVNTTTPPGAASEAWAYAMTCTPTAGPDDGHPVCWLHLNPQFGSATPTGRTAILAHELGHCFEYDLIGTDTYQMPAWLREGLATFWMEPFTSDEPSLIAHWDRYLTSPETSLYARTYDAVGMYAHMQEAGLSPWQLGDQLMLGWQRAFAQGQSEAASDDAAFAPVANNVQFLQTWASGFAMGRRPGPAWTITEWPGLARVTDRYTPEQLAVGNGFQRDLPIAAAADLLVRLDLQADVVQITTTAGTRGLLGPDGSGDRTLADMNGQPLCAVGTCTCPAGTASAGVTLPALGHGPAYLEASGGTGAGSVRVVGETVAQACAQPPSSCLVGTWRSTSMTGRVPAVDMNEQGGAGVGLRIGADGAAQATFTGMSPVTFTASSGGVGSAGRLIFAGTGTVQFTLPAGSASGYLPTGHSDLSQVTISLALTKPTAVTVYDHKAVTATSANDPLGNGAAQPPLFGGGTFTCSATTFTLTNALPDGSATTTWTFERQ